MAAPQWEDYAPEQPAETKWKWGWKTAQEYFDPSNPLYQSEDAGIWGEFGTDPNAIRQQYGATPVVWGYTDENGVWHSTKSLYNQQQQLQEMRETKPQGFDEFMRSQFGGENPYTPITQEDVNQDIAGLLDTDIGADMTSAWNQAASILGFESLEEMQGALGNEWQGMAEAFQQPAFSEEDYGRYWRAAQAGWQYVSQQNQRMVEALGAEGRTGAAFQQRSAAVNEMQNTVLQYQVALMDKEQLQRQLVYESHRAKYELLASSGQAVAGQYLTALQQDRANALQAYAVKWSIVAQQNQQYLEMYGQDLERVNLHAQLTYQSLMAELGVEQALIERSQDMYNLTMQPYLDAYNLAFNEYQTAYSQWEAQRERSGGFLKSLWGGIVMAFGVAACFVPGAQGVGAALIAGGATILAS